MSSASVIGVAPCLIRLLVPSALGGFDDDDSKRQPRDQSIAARKIPRARLPAERHFSKRRPRGQDVVEQIDMLGRIDAVLAAGKNRDRAGCEAGAMRGGIDAARQSRRDGKSCFTQAARQPLGTSGRASTLASPRIAISGGASSIICSRRG